MRIDGIKLLKAYSGGEFLGAWYLAGKQKASVRSHILETFTGQKWTNAKSGVTALEDYLMKEFDIPDNVCDAERHEKLNSIINQ